MREGGGGGRTMLHLLNCQQSGEKSAERGYNWEFQRGRDVVLKVPINAEGISKRCHNHGAIIVRDAGRHKGSITACLIVFLICITCSVWTCCCCPEQTQNLHHKRSRSSFLDVVLWSTSFLRDCDQVVVSANALIGFLWEFRWASWGFWPSGTSLSPTFNLPLTPSVRLIKSLPCSLGAAVHHVWTWLRLICVLQTGSVEGLQEIDSIHYSIRRARAGNSAGCHFF